MLRQIFLVLICAAWIEFAIFSPQIEQITHEIVAHTTAFFRNPVPFALHYEEEHTRLLQSIQRSSGKWDSSHPRHRLLTALHGYARYKDSNLAEVDRWRNLYECVPKRQRLVGYLLVPVLTDLADWLTCSNRPPTTRINSTQSIISWIQTTISPEPLLIMAYGSIISVSLSWMSSLEKMKPSTGPLIRLASLRELSISCATGRMRAMKSDRNPLNAFCNRLHRRREQAVDLYECCYPERVWDDWRTRLTSLGASKS